MLYAYIAPRVVAAAGATFPVVCFVLVSLRLYARRVQDLKWGLDDWLVMPAVVCTVITTMDESFQ